MIPAGDGPTANPSERYSTSANVLLRGLSWFVPTGAGGAASSNLTRPGGRRSDPYDAPAMKAVTM